MHQNQWKANFATNHESGEGFYILQASVISFILPAGFTSKRNSKQWILMTSSNLQCFFLFQERREDARFWRRKAIELEEQKRWAQGPSGVSTTDNPYRSVEKARPNSAIEVKKMVNTPPSFNLSPRPASSCLPESMAGGLATIFFF